MRVHEDACGALLGAAAADRADYGERRLDELPMHRPAQIAALDPAAAGEPTERARQLAEIGFVPGERVSVLARGWPGGDPLVVKVGPSRFALRRAEAACVRVRELP